MKKRILVLCLIFLIVVCGCVFAACNNVDDQFKDSNGEQPAEDATAITSLSQKLVAAFDAITAIKEVTVNDATCTITATVETDVTSLNLTELNVQGATITVYADEARTRAVREVGLSVGENVYYVSASMGDVSESYTFFVTRIAPAVNPEQGGESGGEVTPGPGVGSDEEDDQAKVIAITGGTVVDLVISYEVAENIEYVDLSGMLTVSKNSSWQLYEDIAGQKQIPTKYASNLRAGFNIFYVVVNSADYTINRTYTLKIWKNYSVSVTYRILGEVHGEETALTHTTLEDYPAPEVEGYTFIGWYCAGTYVVGDDLVFDAEVTANKYTVTLDPTEGELGEDDAAKQTVTFDAAATFPVPTRTGYSFTGWYYNAETTEGADDSEETAKPTQITDGEGKTLAVWKIAKDVTLIADWQINSYDVTLVSNPRDVATFSGAGTYEYGAEVTLTATTRTGYVWLGWYYDGNKVSEEGNLTYTFDMLAKDMRFEGIYCPVTLRVNNQSAGSVSTFTGGCVFGEVTLQARTNTGYTFVGWYDEDAKTFISRDLVTTFKFPFAYTKEYTATWCKVTVTRSNTSAGSITSLTGRYCSGDTATVTATTNNGYTWLGWYKDGVKVGEGASYEITMPTENETYTATWKKCPVSLTKNIDEAGSVSGIPDKTAVGESITITATTNKGYTWVGWYKDGVKVSTDTQFAYTFELKADAETYEARWCKVSLAVSDEAAGSVPTLKGTYVEGESVTVEAKTTPGYTWVGWYKDGEVVEENLSFTFDMPSENATYTATWTYYTLTVNKTEGGTYTASPASNVIHFNTSGGSSIPDQKGRTIAYKVPYKTDYAFTGWYADADCMTPYDFTAPITKDVTLYAGWKKMMNRSDKQIVNYIDIVSKYNDPDNALSRSTNSGYLSSYTYFTALTDGTYTVYCKNKSYYEGSTIEIENDTQRQRIYYSASANINDYRLISSFSAMAGDVIYIYNGGDKSFSLYVTGGAYPETTDGTGSSGSSLQEEKIARGETVTLTAETEPGYTFLGWYNGEIKLSSDLSYSFTMPEENLTYMAKWTTYTLTTGTTLEGAGDYPVYDKENVSAGEQIVLTATTNPGYTWVGWALEGADPEDSSATVTLTMPKKDVTVTAIWSKVTIEKSIEEAGTVTELTETYVVNDTVTLTATTNPGYTWLGWFKDGEMVSNSTSYEITMLAENETYTANWEYVRYTITYHLDEGINAAGNPTTFTVNEAITLLSPSKPWYSFKGWYREPALTNRITAISVGTTADVDVYAEWQEIDGSITYYLDGGVNPETNPVTYTREQVGQTVDLADPTKITAEKITEATHIGNGHYSVKKEVTSYTFLGWYTEASFVNQVTTIILSADTIVLYAKWSATTSTTTTTTEQSYLRDGKMYIYFGSYPQTKVTDSSITNALRSAAGTLPTSSNSQSWTSYGYYINGSVSNYMWYIDLEYLGEKYRGVYFTSYRPYFTTNSSSSSNSYQDNNGYSTSTVYWFRYDPIKWCILSEGSGKALILSQRIIDSQQFDYDGSYSNNYKDSTIRAWLNDTFYNTAFTDLQKQLIVLTTVNNSARSTNPNNNATAFNGGNNEYACANTEDHIFLLSEQEVTNSAYGFNSNYGGYDIDRQKLNTDYAKSQGVYTNTDSGYYVGNGGWWLRSPYYEYSLSARSVSFYCNADAYNYVYLASSGVVPALWIRL